MNNRSSIERVVSAAARAAPDNEAVPLLTQAHHSTWTHLYLGGLHLDAIRRQRRGERVDAVLRRLRSRAQDTGHNFYAALARTEGW